MNEKKVRGADFNALSREQQKQYNEGGYVFPIRVLTHDEINHYVQCFLDYRSRIAERLKTLPPREQYYVFSETHTFLHWVYELVSHPRMLDAVQQILGPDLLIWNTRWFAKMPGDSTYIAWHQDTAYWGLHPPKVTTAWIALSDSTAENGGMRVIPGTHQGPLLPQTDTYAPDNALSRGQEIAVQVDESKAISIDLKPGEMSLHHIGIVHGSLANQSQHPRIGIAVRFISPEVVQEGVVKQWVLQVRGEDRYGHFDIGEPPKPGQNDPENAIHSEAVRRMLKNLMPEDYSVDS